MAKLTVNTKNFDGTAYTNLVVEITLADGGAAGNDGMYPQKARRQSPDENGIVEFDLKPTDDYTPPKAYRCVISGEYYDSGTFVKGSGDEDPPRDLGV